MTDKIRKIEEVDQFIEDFPEDIQNITVTALSWIICIVGVILVLYSIDGLTITIK